MIDQQKKHQSFLEGLLKEQKEIAKEHEQHVHN